VSGCLRPTRADALRGIPRGEGAEKEHSRLCRGMLSTGTGFRHLVPERAGQGIRRPSRSRDGALRGAVVACTSDPAAVNGSTKGVTMAGW